MADIQRLSEAMYVGLCHKIGTPEVISMRRDAADIEKMIQNDSYGINNELMLSGSHREGFRLSESDQDYMYWPQDHKVICDLSQAQHYRYPGTTLFLMECVESRPGFVLLQLLTPSSDRIVASSCVRVNDLVYISSFIHRKLLLSLCKESKEHGPCLNRVTKHSDIDSASCFSCDFWPPLAASWTQRCHSWPPTSVLYEIIVSGCHFMAIGSKGSPDEYREWRLSFSQAEQKLVYAMNHCQFLVYGLLKLFLKEVINQENQEKMLCSYFMKTAVFWEIQENNLPSWSPQNILFCFWACYKRIMKWVYKGYCPNFFVTENNMFFGKIWGCAQSTLFLQLNTLYEKGMSCLLYSQSVRSYLYETICSPVNEPNMHNSSTTFHVSFVTEIIEEIFNRSDLNIIVDMTEYLRCLKYLEHISKTNLTKYQALYVHLSSIACLTHTAFSTRQLQMHFSGNKLMYKVGKLSCNMLKIVARSGIVSDMLYLAMYYYSTCRYTEALSVLTMTEVQFRQRNLTYNGNGYIEKSIVQAGGNCLLENLKSGMFLMFCRLSLVNELFYIKHLALEQRISKANETFFLDIRPLVLLRMLYVLCYSKVNKDMAQEALYKLYILVHHGWYISDHFRDISYLTLSDHFSDISYQILGICQEICGDLPAAIDSYNLSLTCEPYNNIRGASLIRIQHALSKIGNTR